MKRMISEKFPMKFYFDVMAQTPSQSLPGGLSLNMVHRSINTAEGVVLRDGK